MVLYDTYLCISNWQWVLNVTGHGPTVRGIEDMRNCETKRYMNCKLANLSTSEICIHCDDTAAVTTSQLTVNSELVNGKWLALYTRLWLSVVYELLKNTRVRQWLNSRYCFCVHYFYIIRSLKSSKILLYNDQFFPQTAQAIFFWRSNSICKFVCGSISFISWGLFNETSPFAHVMDNKILFYLTNVWVVPLSVSETTKKKSKIPTLFRTTPSILGPCLAQRAKYCTLLFSHNFNA